MFQAIAPLGWRVTASMDVAAKNLDNNDRYSYEGLSEDMHTWFFLYDEKIAAKYEAETPKQVNIFSREIFCLILIFPSSRSTTKICVPALLCLTWRLSEVSTAMQSAFLVATPTLQVPADLQHGGKNSP